MLQPGRDISSGLYGDASITIPLLRGAGRHIAAEPLTQAERDTLYAVWTFERYKQEFTVTIVANYLGVLQAEDLLYNQEQNYKGLVVSTRRASRLAEAGKLPQIQVDQALQNELRARERWISARLSLESANDQFKLLLGLPTDATIQLDRHEMSALETDLHQRLKLLFHPFPAEQAAVADSPVQLLEPDPTLAGPLELDYPTASNIALQQRLDLRIVNEQVNDAQRQVVISADALRAELTLLGSAATGTGRSVAALQPDNSNRLEFDQGSYQALLTLDLPFERTAEAIAYRDSYISLEQAVRSVQKLEDQIKLEVRENLRQLHQTRSSLRIQDQAVKLAERRVRGAELQLQAGRAEMRDLLDAQEALLSAKNSLTSAMVNYRLAELALQRDLGVLNIDSDGLWLEYTPEKANS
jgi:outer membrane protein TolC